MPRSRSHTRGKPHGYPRGTLSVTREGYGFVQTAEGEFFIPAAKMNGAFDGDTVEVSPARQERSRKALAAAARDAAAGRKREARVKRVVDRAHADLVGRYEVAEPFGVVVPEDPRIPYDIFTLRSESPDVPDGAIVRVAIATYPSHKEAATGTVVEVLGDEDDERVPIDLIVARHKLGTAFSDAAIAQAADARVDGEGALAAGYRDLRDRFAFTIDPADARDFDDAVSICSVVLTNDGTGRGAIPAEDGVPAGLRQGCGQKLRSLPSAPPAAGQHCVNPGQPASPSLLDEGREANPGEAGGIAADAQGARKYWRVGVHIADVSHYVAWGSSVDLDARRRATSVYLVDRVIPMLPEALSNDVCSLKPGEERRTMTVDLLVDEAGQVVEADVYPALIRSSARLTYEQAQELIDAGEATSAAGEDAGSEAGGWAVGEAARAAGDADAGNAAGHDLEPASDRTPGSVPGASESLSSELGWRVRQLSAIAKQRMALRAQAGGVDFDTAEAKVALDAAGAPIYIVLRKRTDATQLIEEAMIAANEAVARYLRDAGFPCVYRVHEKPSRESLDGLVPVLREFAWFKDVDESAFVAGDPHVVAQVLGLAAGRGEAALVTTLVLRAMKRALYSPDLDGHYALASDAYAHFTSPIRRYPDLVVHRMLKAALFGRPEKFDQEASSLAWIAEHSSEMERVAERAARESQEAKIVELMESHVGETFPAMVAGVATYGLFVRLDNTAEAMVEMADLGREYFVLDPVRHTLTGSDSGKEYRLGKRVAVRLVEADRRTRRLRFKLVKR